MKIHTCTSALLIIGRPSKQFYHYTYTIKLHISTKGIYSYRMYNIIVKKERRKDLTHSIGKTICTNRKL